MDELLNQPDVDAKLNLLPYATDSWKFIVTVWYNNFLNNTFPKKRQLYLYGETNSEEYILSQLPPECVFRPAMYGNFFLKITEKTFIKSYFSMNLNLVIMMLMS